MKGFVLKRETECFRDKPIPALACSGKNTSPVSDATSHAWRVAMNEPVWILSALFGFAILIQLIAEWH